MISYVPASVTVMLFAGVYVTPADGALVGTGICVVPPNVRFRVCGSVL